MEYPFYAIDFGTTNSSLALCEAPGKTKILDIDPDTEISQTVKSVLCIGKDGKMTIGEEAVREYAHAVTTIPVDYKKKLKLEISFTESGSVEVTNLKESLAEYKGEDVPARLFQSPKMFLRFLGVKTKVFGRELSPEDIAYNYLRILKAKADEITGLSIKNVVCGRPVRFAQERFREKQASQNLQNVLKRLGFEKIEFVEEPVAAARHFAETVSKPTKLLVFDSGGGTTDISVVDIDKGKMKVLATTGLPKAGNSFNENIFADRFTPQLGQSSTYGRKHLTVSDSFFSMISHAIPEYDIPRDQYLEKLYEILKLSDDPAKIKQLIVTTEKNLTWEMFDEIETKKKVLTGKELVDFNYDNWGVKIESTLSRSGLEAIISQIVNEMMDIVQEAIELAALDTNGIDAVLRVGGSSLVPLTRRQLENKFGRDRIVSQDIFTDVIAGLAANDS